MTQQFVFKDFIPPFSASFDTEVLVDKSIDTRQYTVKGEITKSSLHSTVSLLHLEPHQARSLQEAQDAYLKVKIFDLLSYDGADFRGLPLKDRLYQLDVVMFLLDETELQPYVETVPYTEVDRKEHYERVLAAGGEGVMLKNLNSVYVDSSSRLRTGWIKVKRRRELDAFVSGYKLGDKGKGWEHLVGAIEFSVFLEGGGTHIVGYATNIPLATRAKITAYEHGVPCLDPDMYWKVAQISGQDFSAREIRLTHCTLDRWRFGSDEKDAAQCVVNLAELQEAASWVS